MPRDQVNANLPADGRLQMRVGIPHRSGALACHAFNEGYPAMVSASAFWNQRTQSFSIPEATDLSEVDFALDSAGYTAMRRWSARGAQAGMAGVFPWSLSAYMELAALMRPTWWAAPDLCTEPEIAGNQVEIDRRIDITAALLEGTLRTLYAWQEQLSRTISAGAVANMVTPPVPVIQGREVSDYRRSLELTLRVWERWTPWLAMPALIGVGSVCRRNLHDKKHGLLAIVAGLEQSLPAGSKLHLFGVKGVSLSRFRLNPAIASTDSMAYDFGARMEAYRAGHSNTVAHRASRMSAWMDGAGASVAPAAGDQPRLDFFSAGSTCA